MRNNDRRRATIATTSKVLQVFANYSTRFKSIAGRALREIQWILDFCTILKCHSLMGVERREVGSWRLAVGSTNIKTLFVGFFLPGFRRSGRKECGRCVWQICRRR